MAAHTSRPTLAIAAVLLAVLFCIPTLAAANGGVNMTVIGEVTGGVPRDAVIVGNYAYVAAQGALSIVNISNPAGAVQVGFCDTPGSAEGVDVVGAYAYVGSWDAGLVIVDISNPAQPVQVAAIDTPGYAYGVDVVGGYAYVASYGAGLVIVDVSNPLSPSTAGSFDTSGYAWDVAVVGSYAYVADGFAGLRILDVSNPAAPASVASYAAGDTVKGVALSGNYAYLADGFTGLRILDVSTPTAVAAVATYDTPGAALDVFVASGYAYVADGGSGLHVLNVGAPSAPSLMGSFDTPGNACGIAVSGSTACLADDRGGLRLIDVSADPMPTVVGQADTADDADGVAVSDGVAYVADGSGGLVAFDVSDPTDPTQLWVAPDPSRVMDVAVRGDYAYVAVWGVGLRVLDLTVPGGPTSPYGGCYTLGNPTGIALSGVRAYLAAGDAGLVQCSISNPAAPWVRATVDTPGSANDVDVSGAYAYVADGAFGLQIIDIATTPSGPVASVGTAGYSWGVDYNNGYAYLASGNAGLEIIDVSNPLSPSPVATLPVSGSAHGVFVAGNYAYIAAGGSGIAVVDVSNPASPTLVASCGTPSIPGPSDVVVAGGYAYVADAEAGLAVIHTIPPYSQLAVLQSPSLAQGIATVDGDDGAGLAYLACAANGVKVVQVSDATYPDDPVRIGSNAGIGTVTDVALLPGQSVYATNSTGLSILSAADPTNPYRLGSVATPGSALGVAPTILSGSRYALVADGDEGLTVAWTRIETSPTIKGSTDTAGWASDVAAATLDGAPYACLADGVTGLRLFSLSAIGAPDVTLLSDGFEDALSGWTIGGTAEWYSGSPRRGSHSVRLSNVGSIQRTVPTVGYGRITVSYYLAASITNTGAAVTAQWYDGTSWNLLKQINNGDADEDGLLRQYTHDLPAVAGENPSFALRFAVAGSGVDDLGYVDDVLVISASASDPVEVGFYNTPGRAVGVSVSGTRAYVADGNAGVRVIDISRPSLPVEIGYCDTPGWADSVVALGNWAFVADGNSGVFLLDFTTPTNPVSVAYYQTPGWASDVSVLGNAGYVADTGWGLEILALWKTFPDVPFFHWAYSRIEDAVTAAIVQGYDDKLFHPEYAVSRDQMAVFIARADTGGAVPAYTGVSHFSDVPATHWAYDEVEYCYGRGIITGYTVTLYLPGEIVTRADMAVFMARARGWVSVGDNMAVAPALFYDIPAGFWAGTAIQACVANSIVYGYPDGFYQPRWAVSRDQMTVFVGRTFTF